jgi:hypothetical protein
MAMTDTHSIGGAKQKSPTRLIAIVIVVIVVASLALAYLFTDVFGSTPQATIQIRSIDFPEDVQYEICVKGAGVPESGEMLIDGALVSNGSEVYRFEGFAAVEIMFRHTGWPGQDWICPYLLSDGQTLVVLVWPSGGVGWQLSY